MTTLLSSSSSSSFVIATFNVNCDFPEHGRDKVVNSISACNADIVCLQETNEQWEAYIRPKLSSIYSHIRFHNQPRNKWAGYAILSKFPIGSWIVIPELERGWYPAGLITVKIPSSSSTNTQKAENDNEPPPPESSSSSSHKLLQLLIVHLRAPVEFSKEPYWWGGHVNWIGGYFSKRVKQKRLHEITTFSNHLDTTLPTCIVGDFNERRLVSNCLQYLLQNQNNQQPYNNLTNIPKQSMENSCFSITSCCHGKNTWHLDLFGCTIFSLDYDHIVYSDKYLLPTDDVAYVHKDGGSDHRLVSARFQFK